MATQIFRVDLSEGARDFQPTATEPGLAMLDRPGANFAILHQWFGTLVAEPEWEGETVNFYVLEQEGGRIERVDCYPATKRDMEGPLADDLQTLQTRIKKVVPESSTEQLLLKIVRQQFQELTFDLEKSDFDCYFFKYRQGGGPWKLVWCWGFQRTDLQPCPSLICNNPECNQLFVRRPKTKNRCPGCQCFVDRKGRTGLAYKLRANALPLLLLLIALLALFALFNRPKLVVSPGEWSGPPKSRVAFKVYDKRWYFFKSDVTAKVLPQSNEKRVMEFDKHGCTATARAMGQVTLSFHYEDRVTSIAAVVGPADPPDSISIELDPDKLVLGVGSTAKMTVWGQYEDRDPIDFTELVSWENSDDQIVVRRGARVEGVAPGEATIKAFFPVKVGEDPLADSAELTVKEVDYQTVEVSIDPNEIPVGGSGKMTIDALDADDERYCMLGSRILETRIEPSDLAEVDGDYVAGRKVGPAKLTATILKPNETISEPCDFTVTDGTLLAGDIGGPEKVKVRVDEYVSVDLASASILPFEGVSEDPAIAEALSGDDPEIVGRSVGTTKVTFTQGENEAVIEVEVIPTNIVGLRIEPSDITLSVGESQMVRVLAVTDDGQFDMAPDRIEWVTQPKADYAQFNRDLMELIGGRATPESESEDLVAKVDDFGAQATVQVGGDPLAVAMADGEFGAHPPINGAIGGDIGLGDYGTGAIVDNGIGIGAYGAGSPWVGSGIPAGSVITGLGGTDLAALGPGGIREYIGTHGLGPGALVDYIGPDGVVGRATLPAWALDAYSDVVVTSANTSNVRAGDFSAAINLQVRETAEYRITDSGGTPLSNFQTIPASSAATIPIANVPRGGGGDKYKLYVERSMNGTTERFPFSLILKNE